MSGIFGFVLQFARRLAKFDVDEDLAAFALFAMADSRDGALRDFHPSPRLAAYDAFCGDRPCPRQRRRNPTEGMDPTFR